MLQDWSEVLTEDAWGVAMKFRSIAGAAAACAVFPAAAGAATCTAGLVADLKVTINGLWPLAKAKINGDEVSLIIDSGAFFSGLSRGTAAQLKLVSAAPPALEDAYMEGFGGRQSISVTTVKAFTIAGQTLSNIEFIVSDNELSEGVAGFMGQNILGVVDVYYDLANGSIKLLRPKDCGDRALIPWDTSLPFSMIPLEWTGGPVKATVGEAFVNGKRVRVGFDTGGTTSMLSLGAARRADVATDGPGATPRVSQRGGVGPRMVETWTAPVASFKIGDEEVRNTRLRIAATLPPDVDMLLGADFFLSHKVYVANSQHRVYFTYNGGPVFNLAAAPQTDAGSGASAQATSDKQGDKPSGASDNAKGEPTDADGFSRRGAAFAGRREFASAISDLTRATALAPTEAKYFTQRAIVYLQNGQPFLGMTDLDQALKLKPDDVEALVARAQLRVEGREMPRAITDLDSADRVLPKEADVRLEMGHLYGRADSAPSAIRQYNQWIKAHPEDNRMAQALAGRCWVRALWDVDTDKALADCDGALRRNHEVAGFFTSRGLAHLRLGDNDRAIDDFDAAIALDPKIPWSLYGRGLAKLRKAETADGKADLAAAATLEPRLPDDAKAHGLSP
jgi:tetratricopeptide (TPR) repeat protein/predicted aspartyl protease